MVVMARTLGIPARMAVGYAPGQQVQVPDAPPDAPTSPLWQVRQKNAHAWAELYFPGYGWQIFEATKSIHPIARAAGTDVDGRCSSGGPLPSAPRVGLEPGDGDVSALPSLDGRSSGRAARRGAAGRAERRAATCW